MNNPDESWDFFCVNAFEIFKKLRENTELKFRSSFYFRFLREAVIEEAVELIYLNFK